MPACRGDVNFGQLWVFAIQCAGRRITLASFPPYAFPFPSHSQRGSIHTPEFYAFNLKPALQLCSRPYHSLRLQMA